VGRFSGQFYEMSYSVKARSEGRKRFVPIYWPSRVEDVGDILSDFVVRFSGKAEITGAGVAFVEAYVGWEGG
jgi:hypothetical protein